MRINLQDPNDFTVENLRKMIASQDDSVNTQFRATKDGYLFLWVDKEELPAHMYEMPEGVLMMETLCAGNSYVGQEASEDDRWVNEAFRIIQENWISYQENPDTYLPV